MSLDGLNPAPLQPDARASRLIRAEMARIMSAGPATADEEALIDLVDTVADMLHMGRITVDVHDVLCAEIKAVRMTLV